MFKAILIASPEKSNAGFGKKFRGPWN